MKLNYISLLAAAAIFVAPTLVSAQNDSNDSQGGVPAASSDAGTPPAAAPGTVPPAAPGTVPPPAPGAVPAEGAPADANSANDSLNNSGNSSSN
jgi:hypothetical protein